MINIANKSSSVNREKEKFANNILKGEEMKAIEKKVLTADEAKRAYQRAWRAKNREKVKEYNRRYWLRFVEKQQQREIESEGDIVNHGRNEVNQ